MPQRPEYWHVVRLDKVGLACTRTRTQRSTPATCHRRPTPGSRRPVGYHAGSKSVAVHPRCGRWADIRPAEQGAIGRLAQTVVCWGDNTDGQTDAPEGKFSTVSAGDAHSCGIRSDRTVVCWGQNSDGRAEAPDGKFSSVSAGERHSCGIRTDGTVACWDTTLMVDPTHPKESSGGYQQGLLIRVGFVPMGLLPAGGGTPMVRQMLPTESSARYPPGMTKPSTQRSQNSRQRAMICCGR